MKKLFILLFVFLVSCSDSTDRSISKTMFAFVNAVNEKDTDKLIENTDPTLFNFITKQAYADYFIGSFNRFTRIKKLNKVYGPYRHNGKYYALADFKFQRGKLVFKRKTVEAYLFVSEDGETWKIIPFPYKDILNYVVMLGDGKLDSPHPEALIPKEISDKLDKEYIPGSSGS